MNAAKLFKILAFSFALFSVASVQATTPATWVVNTSLKPTSRVGVLYTYFKKQGQLICTASLIGPSTVVTAGHCVYDRYNKEVAQSAVFMKGMGGMQFNQTNNPQKSTTSTTITPHPKFISAKTTEASDNWDIGVINLKEPIGLKDHFKIASASVGIDRLDQGVETAVGILGYDGFYDAMDFLNAHPELTSAPSDKLLMSFLSSGESVHKESGNVLGHPFETRPGFSGGPLIVFYQGEYQVFAVHKGQQEVRKYKFTPGGIFEAEGTEIKWKMKLFVPIEREVTVATGFTSSILPWIKSLNK
jgi:V8-like Glu-specific endopeptidase